jgi:hypothetical protein
MVPAVGKNCSVCKEFKGVEEFNKCAAGVLQLQSQCKNCNLKASRAWNRSHPSVIREKAARYRERHRATVNAKRRKDFKENKVKNGARLMVLMVGLLIRPLHCERCLKESKPDAHHEDYTKPLEVKWLCRTCHGLERRID